MTSLHDFDFQKAAAKKDTDAVRVIKRRVRKIQAWIDDQMANGAMDFESIIGVIQSRLSGISTYRPRTERVPNVDDVPNSEKMKFVLLASARWYGVQWERLLSKERSKSISIARHVAIYVQHEVVGNSFPQIGKFWGFDHSSAVYGRDKVRDTMHKDQKMRDAVDWVASGLESELEREGVAE